jgi:translation initiation factor 4E
MAENIEKLHYLKNRWSLWTHSSNNNDWSIDSYEYVTTFESIESILTLYENLPENIIKYSMLFIMKEGIKPIWEDKQNINGGCFSYKINNKIVTKIWKELSYALMGETLSEYDIINGITISPKKNFCIIKIWISNCDNTNPEIIKEIEGLYHNECFFKKHI